MGNTETTESHQRPRELWVKPEYFKQIKSGQKKLEVRLKRSASAFNSAETIVFKTTIQGNVETCTCKIAQSRSYKGLTALLDNENVADILPGREASREEITKLANDIFGTTDLENSEFEVLEIQLQ